MGILDKIEERKQAGQGTQSYSSGGGILAKIEARRQAQMEPPPEPVEQEKGWFSKALDYLDKPASAVAGAVEHWSGIGDDENAFDAAVRGWKDNTDYKRVLAANGIDPESWTGKTLNVGGKIALDPTWIVTPARVAGLAGKGAKAIGLADKAADVGRAVKQTSIAQRAIAAAEGVANKEVGGLSIKRWFSETSPLQKELDVLERAQINSADKIREGVTRIEELKKIDPSLGETVTRAIEANPSKAVAGDAISNVSRQQIYDDLIQKGYDAPTVGKVQETVDFLAKMNTEGSEGLFKRGIISEETYTKFKDRYIRREYSKYVSPTEHLQALRETGQLDEAAEFEKGLEGIMRGNAAKKYKLDLKAISQRKDLPEEVQQQLGRIMDATHPFAKGGKITADLINKFDFLESVATKYGSEEAKIGYKLIDGKQFGPLNGLNVPRDVYNEVNRITRQLTEPESWWRKGVAWWKMGKTVLNPATHFRNNISNMVLLNIAGVPVQHFPGVMAETAENWAKWSDEAKKAGTFLSNTLTETELRKFLDPAKGTSRIEKGINAVKTGVGKAADIYQGTEKAGKMMAYVWARKWGKMGPEAAAKFADDALFNYGKVPPIIDTLRKSGLVPFATFPYKATKATAKALYNNPAKVTKYYKPMQATQDQDEVTVMPDYLNPQTLMPLGKGSRTVDGKPQEVSNYLDMQYILPFQSTDQIGLSPALGIYSALKDNVDPMTGKKLVRDGMTDSGKRAAQADYLWKQLAPANPLIPNTYGYDKLINQGIFGKQDYKGRQYGFGEAAAQTIFGLRNVPVNTVEMGQQRMADIKREIQATRYEIKRTQTDKRLTAAQKTERINEYKRALQQYTQEARQVSAALYNLKKKEGGK